ncbi:hypothetical protein BJV82DRAFT_526745 [Fennellomyces sp. T-0311]|nr:hypothetical protein BJV82DRAFT_526745 [Fennellomyces sp. T-0311]
MTAYLPTPAASPPPSMISPIREKKKPNLSKVNQVNRFVQILQKFLKELDGRDKSVKIIQYLFKILLHHKLVHGKTWSPMVSNFSMTRKVLRLGLFMGPARQLLFNKHDIITTVFLVNEFGNDMADDLFLLYKMGLVGPKIGKHAELVAYYCWFTGILHDLHENYMTLRQLRAKEIVDEEKVFTTQLSMVKLTMDGVFCACDIWQPSFSPGVQAWAGFFSGSISGYKLWRKTASSL